MCYFEGASYFTPLTTYYILLFAYRLLSLDSYHPDETVLEDSYSQQLPWRQVWTSLSRITLWEHQCIVWSECSVLWFNEESERELMMPTKVQRSRYDRRLKITWELRGDTKRHETNNWKTMKHMRVFKIKRIHSGEHMPMDSNKNLSRRSNWFQTKLRCINQVALHSIIIIKQRTRNSPHHYEWVIHCCWRCRNENQW